MPAPEPPPLAALFLRMNLTSVSPARLHITRPAQRAHGFTLIEVLVALGIVAIALSAGLQATSALTHNALRQSDILLAHVCAENELIKTRLSRQMPSVGESSVTCEQAGRSFDLTLNVQPTPNPSFRRVTARVVQEGNPVLSLSTIVGRY